MPYADSHCHVSRYWAGSLDNLRAEMTANGVTHAVLVQAYGAGQTPEAQRDGNWRERDHEYLFDCVARCPGIFAPVVLVDASHPDAPAQLALLASRGASGVRLGANDRSPGDDPLAVWRMAVAQGLAISCYGTAADFASASFAALVAALPTARIVIEHLGAHSHPDTTEEERIARRQAFALARFSQLAIKVPGLGEFCPRERDLPGAAFRQPLPPYLTEVFAAFGSTRMLWGSDYPPVRSREGYAAALHGPLALFAHATDADRNAIFHATTRAYFPAR